MAVNSDPSPENNARPKRKKAIGRRRFLKATGWTVGGLTVAYFGVRRFGPVLPSFLPPDDASGVAWLQMTREGQCLFFCPRAEMGQHANTGLMQILAEELNLQVSDIEPVFPTSTADIPETMLTAGSMSIPMFARPMAQGAAGMREQLRSMAAGRLGVSPHTLTDAQGGFNSGNGWFLSYPEIVDGRDLVMDADELPEASLYTFDTSRAHKQVGQPATPPSVAGMVTGAPLYAADIILENMVYGRAVQPPTRAARLVKVDDAKARALPGFLKTVADFEGNFVGVVGETPGAVNRAVSLMEVAWQLPPVTMSQESIDGLLDVDLALAKEELEHSIADGSIDAGQPWDLDMRFDIQVQSHAAQEPRAAVIRLSGNGSPAVEMWTGSQDPFLMQRFIADELRVDKSEVVVHSMLMGGGFGGRELQEVQFDALRLARHIDRPIKVQWTREDEFAAARNRPGSSHRVRLKADSDNRITVWSHDFVSGYVLFALGRLPALLQGTARALTGDLGAARGAAPPYRAGTTHVAMSDVDLPVDLGSWRSLGAAPNVFVVESAVDALAHSLGQDPVEFRLRNMAEEHERLRHCLIRARELASSVPLIEAEGHGRGYACGIYERDSFVAVSADVHVDRASGEISVLRMCCAQDVGLAINPDQLRAQVESNLIWGIGMALMEKVEVDGNGVSSTNFDTYRIPRISHAPEFEIEIVPNPGFAPAGAGETALIAAAPAIVNAVFDGTGIRYTRLPLSVPG